ncbi:hypothetical protein CFP56_001104 [Quercus suber]|uniref:Uncharacterized protein n=1 Tax=Quercus suber TaxID=58331 RepID=A0AAW0IME9_QUESU
MAAFFATSSPPSLLSFSHSHHHNQEISQREQEGQLDEGFLSEVNAQLRQAKEDGDKPGLEAMLQKVLQLYASRVLSKRSYAKKAPEEEWNKLLINGMTVGKGDIHQMRGRILPTACSYGIFERHPIKSGGDCPSTSGQAIVEAA